LKSVINESGSIYQKFGRYYDILYDPFIDYNSDCDFIEEILSSFGTPPLQLETRKQYTLLDAGCGTGKHATDLARRGFKIVGFDRSRYSLISAMKKTTEATEISERINYFQQDLRNLYLKTKFDAIMALFGVLSYIHEKDDLMRVLDNFRAHLEPGRLLIGEIWQNTGVFEEYQDRSVGKDPENNLELERTTESRTPEGTSITEVKMDFTLKELKSGSVIETFTENHYLRSYDLFDFTEALKNSGFELIRFSDADTKIKKFKHINPKTLRTFFVAKAILI
jgi:SAM-dependent methyltransferase